MRYAYLFLLLNLSISGVYAQKASWRVAEKYFNSFQYAAAAKAYEQLLSADPNNKAASERLVACYEKLNDPVKSEAVLSSLCASIMAEPKYLKMYADVLAENSKYDKASEWYKVYISHNDDENVRRFIEGYNRLEDFYKDSVFYKIGKPGFNSDQSDFSPVYYKKGIAFCSARGSGKGTYLWNNSSFIDLYSVKDLSSEPVALDKTINSSFHEGPATFSTGFDTIFFTRNNYINSKKANSKDGVMKLKIFYAVLENGNWGQARNIPLNSNEYSIGHPFLSLNHKLYFVSDMPGGLGGTDIYYTKLENGKWLPPVNLGAPVNSPGNDMFPFVNEKGDLFFASNGHAGLGGLDIFHSVRNDQKFDAPKNMGYPVNSSRDDFALIISGAQGYFSSNRGTNAKDDNIYSFSIEKFFPVTIQAINKEGSQLENFTLSIINTSDLTSKADEYQVAKNYEGKLNIENEYKVICTKDGYQRKEELLAGKILNDLLLTKKQFQVVLHEATATINVDLVGTHGERLSGGVIWLVNLKTNEIKKYVFESNNSVSFELTSGIDYELTSQHTGFRTKTQSINLGAIDPSKTLVIELSPNEALFEKNEIGQIIELDIKYDLGKATIRQDAARELNKLVEFLRKNPTVKVELGSHTDVRGTEQDNLKLSQRRAESSVQYIARKGIDGNRLIPIGYGEDDLKVQNATTEEEHQLNRRTTVKIVGI